MFVYLRKSIYDFRSYLVNLPFHFFHTDNASISDFPLFFFRLKLFFKKLKQQFEVFFFFWLTIYWNYYLLLNWLLLLTFVLYVLISVQFFIVFLIGMLGFIFSISVTFCCVFICNHTLLGFSSSSLFYHSIFGLCVCFCMYLCIIYWWSKTPYLDFYEAELSMLFSADHSIWNELFNHSYNFPKISSVGIDQTVIITIIGSPLQFFFLFFFS